MCFFIICLYFLLSLGAQSSRKSSVSTAAPEVLVTKPADKDREVQNEAAPSTDTKPKSLLSLLPVISLFYTKNNLKTVASKFSVLVAL